MAGKKINLTDQLKNYFGFDTFKGNQEAIIQNLLAGNDTFVLMPTGGGKSLCYQLPSLLMDGTAIVISPLIALMKNQVDAMRNFSEEDGIAHFINSSLNKSAIDQVKSDILAGRTKLLYVAPESLTKEENVEFLKTVKISFYAVDEAHCISEWGHDFRPEYRRIRPIINEIGKAPLIALTATATPKVQHDIQKNLGMVEAQVFKSSFNRPNLYYEVRPKTANVDKDIIKFIKNNPEKSGIIYCLSRKKVEELAEILQANGINARAYHAGMDSATRTQNQDDFLMEKIDVIVATIAFGMGIDKPDVRFVAHIDMPKSIENYFQETGRAGRDGKPAQAWMCYGLADVVNQMRLIEMSDADDLYKRRSSIKLDAMLALAETVHCRRKLLLNYFGEEAPETCGNCDNCLEPPEIIDATVAAQKLVSCIWRCNKLSGHTFGARHIVDVLLGNPTEKVFAEGHDKLSTFGIGKDLDPDQWRRLIRQLIVLRILTVDAERYSALALAGGRASELLKGKIRVTMRKNGLTATKAKSGRRGNKEEWNPSEETRLLFEALRAWRLEEARRLEQPAYCIFWDSALKAIAQAKPGTIEEMRRIDRIGNGRIEKYGEALLEVIKAFEADDTRL